MSVIFTVLTPGMEFSKDGVVVIGLLPVVLVGSLAEVFGWVLV